MIRETRWRRSIHNVVGSCENGMRVFPSFTEYESASVSIPLRGWKADRKLHSRVHFRSTSYWPRAVASKNIIKLVYPSGSSIGSRGRPFRPTDTLVSVSLSANLCSCPFASPPLSSLISRLRCFHVCVHQTHRSRNETSLEDHLSIRVYFF